MRDVNGQRRCAALIWIGRVTETQCEGEGEIWELLRILS